jgi:hypothetical protein
MLYMKFTLCNTGPEIRRHRHFSYITTVEKDGDEIRFHDPVREEALISYPPWYQSVTVRAGQSPRRGTGLSETPTLTGIG